MVAGYSGTIIFFKTLVISTAFTFKCLVLGYDLFLIQLGEVVGKRQHFFLPEIRGHDLNPDRHSLVVQPVRDRYRRITHDIRLHSENVRKIHL